MQSTVHDAETIHSLAHRLLLMFGTLSVVVVMVLAYAAMFLDGITVA